MLSSTKMGRSIPLGLPLGSELPQVVVYVQVSVAHSLGPRQVPEHCVRSESSLKTTETVK